MEDRSTPDVAMSSLQDRHMRNDAATSVQAARER